jgi:hypothetical protein
MEQLMTMRSIHGLVVMSLLAAGCAATSTVQAPPPLPPAPVETVPQRPSPSYVWIPGGYVWQSNSRSYVWVPGHWTVPPAGFVWVPGHWETQPTGTAWVDGQWRHN